MNVAGRSITWLMGLSRSLGLTWTPLICGWGCQGLWSTARDTSRSPFAVVLAVLPYLSCATCCCGLLLWPLSWQSIGGEALWCAANDVSFNKNQGVSWHAVRWPGPTLLYQGCSCGVLPAQEPTSKFHLSLTTFDCPPVPLFHAAGYCCCCCWLLLLLLTGIYGGVCRLFLQQDHQQHFNRTPVVTRSSTERWAAGALSWRRAGHVCCKTGGSTGQAVSGCNVHGTTD
jgi:hypothetical protein